MKSKIFSTALLLFAASLSSAETLIDTASSAARSALNTFVSELAAGSSGAEDEQGSRAAKSRKAAVAKAMLRVDWFNGKPSGKAKFLATMLKNKGVSQLPGVGSLSNSFPAAAIVRADGTEVKVGHGSLVRDWRAHTIEADGAGE